MHMPPPINIVVRYDATLQKITNRAEDPVVMSEGSTFAYLLQNVLMAYPQIAEQYPPGVLEFSVNSVSPKPHTVLFESDVVLFATVQGSE